MLFQAHKIKAVTELQHQIRVTQSMKIRALQAQDQEAIGGFKSREAKLRRMLARVQGRSV